MDSVLPLLIGACCGAIAALAVLWLRRRRKSPALPPAVHSLLLEVPSTPRAVYGKDGLKLVSASKYDEITNSLGEELAESLAIAIAHTAASGEGRKLDLMLPRLHKYLIADLTPKDGLVLVELRSPAIESGTFDEFRLFKAVDSMAASLSFGMGIFDKSGVFLYSNPALNSMLGFDSHDTTFLSGISVYDMISFLSPANLGELVRKVRQREPLDGEVLRLSAGGRTVSYQFFLRHGEGPHSDFSFAVFFDCTEINERLERAIKQSEAYSSELSTRSVMLGVVTHEIRNTLNLFAGEMLAKEGGDGDSLLTRRVDLLQSLVNDILEFAKLDNMNIQPNRDSFSPIEHVEDLASMFARMARDKGLRFEVSVKSPIPVRVFADRSRITQVLMNIVSNAIKYVDSGHIRLLVSHSDGRMHYSVEDTGIGMHPEQQESLFSSFYRTSDSTDTDAPTKGAGLGLAITRKLVEIMGGTIDVKSRPSQGTTFHVSIPVEVASGQQDTARPDQSAKLARLLDEQGAEFPKILVVDDDTATLDLYRVILARLGVDFSMTTNGNSALEIMRSKPIDVLITDGFMVGMSGEELIANARSEFGGGFVAVLLTGLEDMVGRTVKGCDAVVSKPVSMSFWRLFTPSGGELRTSPVNDRINSFASDAELLRLLEEYIQALPEIVSTMRSSAESGDLTQTRVKAHSIKGTAQTYGLELIAQTARDVDVAIVEGDVSAIERGLGRLPWAIEATTEWIRANMVAGFAAGSGGLDRGQRNN